MLSAFESITLLGYLCKNGVMLHNTIKTGQKQGFWGMADNDRRVHSRTVMSAKVKVVHEHYGEFVFSTRDISDGGVFIVLNDEPFTPELGDNVTVQVQGLPIPAPVLDMIVVRKTVDGFGLQFDENDE